MISEIPYRYMEDQVPFLVAWTACFSVYTLWRILHRRLSGEAKPAGPVLTELAGLPLTFMHTWVFYLAVREGDVLSSILMGWWGPGFIATIVFYLHRARVKKPINWFPVRHAIAWACKLSYLVIVGILIYFEFYFMIYAYSVWIISDQIGRLFLADDGDRLRRSFDDYWIVRSCYVLGLLIPLFFTHPWRFAFVVYGVSLLIIWGIGVARLYGLGRLTVMAKDPGLLRNMVYFKDRRTDENTNENK